MIRLFRHSAVIAIGLREWPMLRGSLAHAYPPLCLWIAHSRVIRNRKALPTTLTEESAMAAAAMIGESRMPKFG